MMGLKVEYFVMEKHFDFWVEIANSESMAHYFNLFKWSLFWQKCWIIGILFWGKNLVNSHVLEPE